MQSKSLAFLVTILVAFPVIVLSSNHELFFAIMSLAIAFISVRQIAKLMFGESLQNLETDEDIRDELEELTDIDLDKFGKGLGISCNLLVVLFLFYCAFFLDTIFMKVVASFAIILQVYFIIKKSENNSVHYSPDNHKPQILMSGILNMAVIIFTVINKLHRLY